jgi:VanZ family protein
MRVPRVSSMLRDVGGFRPTGVTRDRHHIVKAWIALILWLIVIAIESTTYLAAQNTSRFLYPLMHFLFGIDEVTFEPYHAFLRKSGHVLGYGLLSILLFRAWRETLPSAKGTRWTLRWASIAMLGTALVASLDEWHQSYLPTRTGTVRDVVLDSCAGIAAQLAIFLAHRWL